MVCAIGGTTRVDLSLTFASQVAKPPSAALEKPSVGRAGLSVNKPSGLYKAKKILRAFINPSKWLLKVQNLKPDPNNVSVREGAVSFGIFIDMKNSHLR